MRPAAIGRASCRRSNRVFVLDSPSVMTDEYPVTMSHDDDTLELLRRALAGLRYGEVVIAVHDGQIVQIARTEKLRPPRPSQRDGER